MSNKYPLRYEDLNEENPWRVPPDYFGNSVNNIGYIKNFISLEDLKTINKFTKIINKWDNSKESDTHKDGASKYSADLWYNRTCGPENIKDLDMNVYNLIDSYIEKMKLVIEDIFKCNVRKRPPVVVCWRAGDFQIPHADKQLQDGRPNAFIDYDLNSLFYYNDDFIGGDLFYPKHGVKIKPEPGMAVFHVGDVNYLHGVTPVLCGERWTTPSFYSIESFKA
jgi:hypothetical protein